MSGRRSSPDPHALALRNGAAAERIVLSELIWGTTRRPTDQRSPPSDLTPASGAPARSPRRDVRCWSQFRRLPARRAGGVRDAALLNGRHAGAASMVRSAPRPSSCRRATLTDALARGVASPLADAADHPLVAADVARLGELRIAALETRNQAMLTIGRHAEFGSRAPATRRQSPTPRALPRPLMVALYRAGRQVDALRVASNARRLLAEEVGVDRRGARRARTAVLMHAPELEAAAPPNRLPF